MTITEALQDENNFNLRLSNNSRWLVGDERGGWIVYSRERNKRNVETLIETKSEAEAVEVLLSED